MIARCRASGRFMPHWDHRIGLCIAGPLRPTVQWKNKASGLREIHRVLRPGGKAMIGGGLGSRYPQWARQEFIRRQRRSQRDMSEEEKKAFAFARHPETFRRLAGEAGLNNFEVVGEGGLGADDSNAGIGIWLRFEKGRNDAA